MKKIFWAVIISAAAAVAIGFCVWQNGQNNIEQSGGDIIEPVAGEPILQKIKLYYYNSANDKDKAGNAKCSRDGLVAVEREISRSKTPVQDAIKLLLQGGLSQEEIATGIATEFPLAGVKLKAADLKDGILTLEFLDPQSKTSGGACRAGILWFQIEATAKQFDGVRQVRFIPETLFQP